MDDFSEQPNILRRKINDLMFEICKNKYYPSVPIKEIEEKLKSIEVKIDDDDFLLLGKEGRAKLDLEYRNKIKLPFILNIQWYKMTSGNYEVNVYAS